MAWKGVAEDVSQFTGSGVGVLTPGIVEPGVPRGRVGCLAMDVGNGSVGCGVGLGKCGIVGVGEGVGDSAIVARALPGVANKSATTNGSAVGSPAQATSSAENNIPHSQR